jgi:hypothetical protein
MVPAQLRKGRERVGARGGAERSGVWSDVAARLVLGPRCRRGRPKAPRAGPLLAWSAPAFETTSCRKSSAPMAHQRPPTQATPGGQNSPPHAVAPARAHAPLRQPWPGGQQAAPQICAVGQHLGRRGGEVGRNSAARQRYLASPPSPPRGATQKMRDCHPSTTKCAAAAAAPGMPAGAERGRGARPPLPPFPCTHLLVLGSAHRWPFGQHCVVHFRSAGQHPPVAMTLPDAQHWTGLGHRQGGLGFRQEGVRSSRRWGMCSRQGLGRGIR